ncbi:hypothetical protein B0H19DRAFT_1075585 [Mycena capillaripes]|nr:hypothetical protein B0H19DRAFT_1075585 [Mycena capillaripes]
MIHGEIHELQAEEHKSMTRFDTAPGCTQSVRIPDGLRLTFFVARRRAMASGDSGAVRKMHDVLLQRAGAVNLTPTQIRGQLEREYRVTLDPAATTARDFGSAPTHQEILEELRYANRRDELAVAAADAEEEEGAGGAIGTALYGGGWEEEGDWDSESGSTVGEVFEAGDRECEEAGGSGSEDSESGDSDSGDSENEPGRHLDDLD